MECITHEHIVTLGARGETILIQKQLTASTSAAEFSFKFRLVLYDVIEPLSPRIMCMITVRSPYIA